MGNESTVAVIGPGACDHALMDMAHELGRLLAFRGFTLVCGGLGGIMRAAAKGARSAGGRTIGILPGLDRGEAENSMEIRLATGLGHMRNYLVVLNADIVIAVYGGWGTLSEIALAKKIGKDVIAIGKWSGIEGIIPAADPAEALGHAERILGKEEG